MHLPVKKFISALACAGSNIACKAVFLQMLITYEQCLVLSSCSSHQTVCLTDQDSCQLLVCELRRLMNQRNSSSSYCSIISIISVISTNLLQIEKYWTTSRFENLLCQRTCCLDRVSLLKSFLQQFSLNRNKRIGGNDRFNDGQFATLMRCFMKPENTRLAFIIVLTIINTFSSIINVNQAKYLCKFNALEVI